MSRVFFDVGVSLDGYIAGPNARPGNPLGDRGTSIHAWMFKTASFREHLGMTGGETTRDDDVVRQVFARSGAYEMGLRMVDEGEVLHMAPVILGGGTRLFDHLRPADLAAEQVEVIDAPDVTHIRYRVARSSAA